ncbi:fimbrial biogenesis chaperone [Dyella monticola]|nr:fimbria/pilus periplasmic chaperone [Dyella monticola]
MKNIWRDAMGVLLVLAFAWARPSAAGVVIDGTRVIYHAQDKEATIKLTNAGKRPILVQTWMNQVNDTSSPGASKVPFTLTPPIFRLEPGKGQAIRAQYTREPLPTDKETLFWLNVLEVPPKMKADDRSVLQFSVRTRIKFIFRPSNLPGSPGSAFEQLSWTLAATEDGRGVVLKASNPTRYYVNFAQVGIKAGNRSYMHPGGGMVAPGATEAFAIPDFDARSVDGVKATFETISDLGAIGKHEKPINP